VFIALELAPCFYALSPNYGDPPPTIWTTIATALAGGVETGVRDAVGAGRAAHQPLRLDAGLGGKGNATRFDRALADLQMDLRIVKVAISEATAGAIVMSTTCSTATFRPWSRQHGGSGAARPARRSCLRYLQTVIAATPRQVRPALRLAARRCGPPGVAPRREGKLRSGIMIEGYLANTWLS